VFVGALFPGNYCMMTFRIDCSQTCRLEYCEHKVSCCADTFHILRHKYYLFLVNGGRDLSRFRRVSLYENLQQPLLQLCCAEQQFRNASSCTPTARCLLLLVENFFLAKSRTTNPKWVTSSIFHASLEAGNWFCMILSKCFPPSLLKQAGN